MDNQMFGPVDNTKKEARQEVVPNSRHNKGNGGNRQRLNGYLKKPENKAIYKDKRESERDYLEREGKELDNRLYDSIEHTHYQAANGKKSNPAGVLNLRNEVDDAIERQGVEDDADDKFFKHGKSFI